MNLRGGGDIFPLFLPQPPRPTITFLMVEKLQRGLPLVFATHLTLESLEIIGQYALLTYGNMPV